MRALRSHLTNFRKKFTNILPFNYLCKLIFQSYEYIQERINKRKNRDWNKIRINVFKSHVSQQMISKNAKDTVKVIV